MVDVNPPPLLLPIHTLRHTLLLRSECILGGWISLSHVSHTSAVFLLRHGQMRVKGGDCQMPNTLSRYKHTTVHLQKMNNSCVSKPGFKVEEVLLSTWP